MTVTEADAASLSMGQMRDRFRGWLGAQAGRLQQFRDPGCDMTRSFACLRRLQRLLFDAGWVRLGWPAGVGGIGGPQILRAMVSEELAVAGYPPPFSFGTQEVLGPAVARFAPPELAAEMLPKLLRGDETWCQGFSEPDAGSDLALAVSVPGREVMRCENPRNGACRAR